MSEKTCHVAVTWPRKRRRSYNDLRIRKHEKNKYMEELLAQKGPISRCDIRSLALSEGGLLNNTYRRRLWLEYLGIEQGETVSECDITQYIDYTQVCLDVHRCNSRIAKGTPPSKVRAIKKRLKNVIIKSLAEAHGRHYYQGYHDVSLTMQYVLGESQAARVMSQLCVTHLASHIRQNLDETSKQMELIIPLVSQKCPELSDFIVRSEAGTMFSLSWIITWFAYVLKDEQVICRLYDVFLTAPPLMAVYLSSSVLLYRKHLIMAVECELSTVHQVLHNLPQDLPWDFLVTEASSLLREYPPNVLKKLPVKQKAIILQVPRFRYLEWSQHWAHNLLQLVNTPAGVALSSSFLVGLAVLAISVYTGRFQV